MAALLQPTRLQLSRVRSAYRDGCIDALCGELDIGATGREAQLAALASPIITTADVQRYIIAPICAHGRCSVTEAWRDQTVRESLWDQDIAAVGPATGFVSHCWQQPFDELLSALNEYMCSVPLDRKLEQYFWLDVFCVDPYAAATTNSDGWSDTFKSMVSDIGHTLLVALPALAPLAVRRSWCIYELFCTLQSAGCQLDVVTSQAEAATLADVRGYESAIATLATLDSQAAHATYRSDKERIDNAITAAGGFAAIDDAVRGRLLAELLQRALARGSEHFGMIRALCDEGASLEAEIGLYRSAALATASNPRCGLIERRDLLRSGWLDTVREADAKVVEYLLQRGSRVNAQSSRTGDTALSSACRYGDRPAVLLLLGARADPNLAQHGLNEGETPFLAAARWGAANVLADLAGAGADVNKVVYSSYLDRHGTAAMWRNMYKSAANLQTLRACGCDLAYTNAEGVGAASLAAEAGFPESVHYLLDEAGVPDEDGALREMVTRTAVQGVEEASPWPPRTL